MMQHPVLWLFLAGIFAGGVLAFLITPARSRKDPAKFRALRPAKICFLLTAVVICCTVCVFAASYGAGFAFRFLYAAAAGFILGCLGLRWKVYVGIPLVVLAITVWGISAQGLAGWNVAWKDVPASRFIVLSLEPEIALSVAVPGLPEIIVRSINADINVETEFLDFFPAYPVLGSLTVYRTIAILSGGVRHEFFPSGDPSLWEKILFSLPSAEIRSFETPLPPLELFSSHNLYVSLEGSSMPYFIIEEN